MIPKGFQLHVTTYAGDDDDRTTQVQSGLTEADVRFSLDLARLFSSESALGNREHADTALHSLVHDVLLLHPNVSQGVRADWAEAPGYTHGTLQRRLLGVAIEGYPENFCKAVSSFEVYYLPEDATHETHRFMEQASKVSLPQPGRVFPAAAQIDLDAGIDVPKTPSQRFAPRRARLKRRGPNPA